MGTQRTLSSAHMFGPRLRPGFVVVLVELFDCVSAWAPSHIHCATSGVFSQRYAAGPRCISARLHASSQLDSQDAHVSLDAAQQQQTVQRREMTGNAAKLAAAGACAFALVQPVMAADKKKKIWEGEKGGTRNKPVVATDRKMEELTATKWLSKHPKPGMRELVVGLNGEPFWLIAEKDPDDDTTALAAYALKAECTHLGCLADWRTAQSKYICPCHGSEYDSVGRVTRGPAPTSLSLAKVDILDNDLVQLSAWDLPDFRT